MTTIHSIVEPRKHVKIVGIGEDDVALDIGRPGRPAVSLAAIRVPVADLRAALDEIAPAGSCTRTESPDLLDGGVTSARIEKEVEEWPLSAVDALAKMSDRIRRAEEERDEARNDLRRALHQRDEGRAGQPRRLTADDFPVEALEGMAQRLRDEAQEWLLTKGMTLALARVLITAALTEPPARPEGAEEIEAILSELPDTMLPATDAGRADLLASRGVRVTGAES